MYAHALYLGQQIFFHAYNDEFVENNWKTNKQFCFGNATLFQNPLM
jgi:hypothetical protein